jgi:hypothetical protein
VEQYAPSTQEGLVKSERALQIAVGLLGVIYLCLLYPLYTDLAHSKWLLVMQNEIDPMFLSWFIALGPFLLLAARKPSAHRLLIAFAGWQALVHAAVMSIQTAEAWNHGVHRSFADVIIFGVIGGIVLTLLYATREQSAAVSRSEAVASV